MRGKTAQEERYAKENRITHPLRQNGEWWLTPLKNIRTLVRPAHERPGPRLPAGDAGTAAGAGEPCLHLGAKHARVHRLLDEIGTGPLPAPGDDRDPLLDRDREL